MIRAALLLAALAALALASDARAQFEMSGGVFAYGEPGDRLLRQAQAQVTMTGELVVDFVSDEATCAAVGRCGLRGTTVWRPGRRARFFVFDVRKRSGRRTVAPAFFVEDREDDPAVLTQVRRARSGGGGSAVCTDAATPAQTFEVRAARGQLVFGVSADGTGPLTTRCPGPLWDDVRHVLPRPRIDLDDLRRRGGQADLRSDQTFGAAGLRGTVRSTIRARIARPRDEGNAGDAIEPDADQPRITDWRITRATGAVVVRVRGAAEGERCGGLDACGLGGTLTVAPRPRDGEVSFFTSPRATGGDRAGGGGGWTGGGAVVAHVARPGEPAACSDTAALPGGGLLLSVRGDTVIVTYAPFGGIPTRCGGPVLGPTLDGLVSGRVSLRALRGRGRVSIRLDRGVTRTTGGFRVSTTSDLTLTLARRR